uniref:Uncharacterized protein n=1 Tax=Romanomermis culicivorax TaxID=13658 RepID=A0A915IYS1_ROMCU
MFPNRKVTQISFVVEVVYVKLQLKNFSLEKPLESPFLQQSTSMCGNYSNWIGEADHRQYLKPGYSGYMFCRRNRFAFPKYILENIRTDPKELIQVEIYRLSDRQCYQAQMASVKKPCYKSAKNDKL